MSVDSDKIIVRAALQFIRQGAITGVPIPASGILTVNSTDGSAITLNGAGALELRGIEYLTQDGDPVVLSDEAVELKFIRVLPGVSITVRHGATEDLQANALDPTKQILSTSGLDVKLGSLNTKMFYASVVGLGFRWVAAHELGFVATTPSDWASPQPTEIPGALDVLGARMTAAEQPTVVVPGTVSALGGDAYVAYRGPTRSIIGITAVLDGGLTVLSSLTLTASINGVPVTDGVIQITAASAGAGTTHSCTPTADNVVVDGAVVRINASTLLNLLPTTGAITLLLGPEP